MKYEMSISENGDYISVKVNQPMTTDLGCQCGFDAARLANERNIKNFMFDVRNAPNLQTVVDDYIYAYKEMPNFRFPKSIRSALLVSPDDRSHNFIETAFQNSGYLIKLFTDESSALSWL